MRRVLHVTRDFPPRNNGGLSRAVGGLVRAARTRGFAPEVLSFDGWRKGAARVQVPPAPCVHRVARGELGRVGPALEAARPDAVVVHDSLLLEHAPAEVPYALMLHVLQAEQSAIRGLTSPTKSELAERAAVAGAAVVIAPSHACAADARRHYPGAAVEVAPLGVDTFIASRGTPREGVLYAARFGDLKGTDLLADAWPHVPSGATLTVAGGLPDHARADAKWRARLGELPRTRLAGWLEGAARERAYAAAGVFVAPSRYETFSLSVAEALARGLRVVASDIGAHRELLEPFAEAAHLHRASDRESLADALGEALAMRPPELRAAALAELTWEMRIDPHLGLWSRL